MDTSGEYDICFEDYRTGSIISWDVSSNFVAVELIPGPYPGPLLACILEPRCPQVGRLGDGLPQGDGCKRTLATLTTSGRAYVWSQADPQTELSATVCLDIWHGSPAFQLHQNPMDAVLTFSTLRPPSPWDVSQAPPHTSREDRRVSKVSELVSFWQEHGLERAFGRPSGALTLPVLRPGMPVLGAVCASGTVHVSVAIWSRGPDQTRRTWRELELRLPADAPGLPAALPLRAAALSSPDGVALEVACVDAAGAVFIIAFGGELFPRLFERQERERDVVIVEDELPPPWQPEARWQRIELPSAAPGSATGVSFLSSGVLLCEARAPGGQGVLLSLLRTRRGAQEAGRKLEEPAWEVVTSRVVSGAVVAPQLGDEARPPAPIATPSADGSLILLSPPGPAPSIVALRFDTLGDARGLVAAGEDGKDGPAATRWSAALSPNTCLAACVTRGGRALHVLPVSRVQSAGVAVQLAGELGKRAAFACVVGSSTWDLEVSLARLVRGWGPSPLSVFLSLGQAMLGASRSPVRAAAAPVWSRVGSAALCGAPDALAACVRADNGACAWLSHVAALLGGLRSLLAGTDAGPRRGREAEREAAYRQLQAGLVVQYWACWIADLSAYLLRCAAVWTRRRAREPGAATAAGSQAVGALCGGAAGQWPADWAARVDAHPDAVPGVRCLADMAFVRDLTSSLAISASYARQLQRALESGRGGGQPEALLQAMRRLATVYKPIVGVLRATAGEADATPGADDGLGGPWRVVHPAGAVSLSWQRLEAALPTTGDWAPAQCGDDSVADLLARARELGIVPDSAGAHRGGAPAAPRGDLQRSRLDDALAAAPPLEGWARGWGDGCCLGVPDSVDKGGDADMACIDIWSDEGALDARWFDHPCAGPPPGPAPANAVDALTGARLDWARQKSFASADGSIVTAELQPSALVLGSLSAWQAAWAVGCPVTGQPWRSVV